MESCFINGGCIYRASDSLCTAPPDGRSPRCSLCNDLGQLPDNYRLAFLLEASPTLCAGKCELRDFLEAADWLLTSGLVVRFVL